ncbi:uncharacterized [Tachysurus ichikawai]
MQLITPERVSCSAQDHSVKASTKWSIKDGINDQSTAVIMLMEHWDPAELFVSPFIMQEFIRAASSSQCRT